MEVFHVRHKKLLLVGAFAAGIYHPSFKRLYPSPILQAFLKIYMYISCLLKFCIPLNGFLKLLIGSQTLHEAIWCIVTMTTGGFNVQPALWWSFNGRKMQKLHDRWDELFGSDSDVEERNALMDIHLKKLQTPIVRASIISGLSGTLWVIAMYFDPERNITLPCAYPYSKESPEYEIWVTMYLIPVGQFGFTTLVTMYFTLIPMTWVSVELIRLRKAMPKIMYFKGREQLAIVAGEGKEFATPFSEVQIRIIRHRLKNWTIQYQKVLQIRLISCWNSALRFRFNEEMKNLLYGPFAFQVVTVFMCTWTYAFNLAQDETTVNDMVGQLFYYLAFFLLFGETCQKCDQLVDQSTTLFYELMPKNWTVLPRDLRRSLRLTVLRSVKPLKFYAFKKYAIGNETYKQIVQSGYAVLNVCLTALQRTKASRAAET